MITHYFTPQQKPFSISKSAQDEIWTVKRHAIINTQWSLTRILSGRKLFRTLLFMVRKNFFKQLKKYSYIFETITKCAFRWNLSGKNCFITLLNTREFATFYEG